jgi:hypothetical protein
VRRAGLGGSYAKVGRGRRTSMELYGMAEDQKIVENMLSELAMAKSSGLIPHSAQIFILNEKIEPESFKASFRGSTA